MERDLAILENAAMWGESNELRGLLSAAAAGEHVSEYDYHAVGTGV